MISSKQKLKKCKGCGINLSLDKQDLGYVPKLDANTKFCYRCFRLKHYNELNNNQHDIKQIVNTNVNSLDLKDKNVFYIIDILDLYNSTINLKKDYQKLFLIINKMDLFHQVRNIEQVKERIIKNINDLNFDYSDILFTSTNSTNSIKKLNYFIKHLKPNTKNIFIGKTNVGKSSIINQLLKLNKLDANLTTNNNLNTTINLQKIKLDHQFIIDTPGINDESNLLNFVNQKELSKLSFTKKNASCINFQIKYHKRLLIENLIAIDVFLDKQTTLGSISFYLNKNLSIQSKKISEEILNQPHKLNYDNNKQINLVHHEFELNNNKTNISISGLGLISFKNIKNIKIYLADKIAINKWKEPII